MSNISDWLVPVLTCIGTIFAGAGLKWVESKLKAAKEKDDTATTLRNELRSDLTALKAENQQHEKEISEWREKYYKEFEQVLLLKAEVESLRRDHEDLKEELKALKSGQG
jgi:uncharacterized protein involved in exopolysaccharide biosynthesis